jgi:sulfopyruvate decarboxylase alpha subunit
MTAAPVAGETGQQSAGSDWPADIHAVLEDFDVRQVPYVPDGGHARLIAAVHGTGSMSGIALTTEEEGVALAAGAWLGGQRAVLLMQSSGVGNCINMLSLIKTCKIPLLMLVTMRGEWGEFNPWQVPMGSTTTEALRLMDVQVRRAERPDEVGDVVRNAATMAFGGGSAVAVLLSQRLVGAKVFTK